MRAELFRTEEVKETALSSHGSARYLSAHRESQRSDQMNDHKLERRVTTPADEEALKVFGQVKTEKAVSEHEKAQKAFHENRERLKALRLAREAAEKAKRT
jgi:RNA-splicing ligase RtcB